MPLSTNLNQNPYWADYSPAADYYQILFKPGVSVQTRELNNLQLWLQNQIEQFGINIFASGSIVSGCNFQFLNPYPYVQINDIDIFNNPTVPASYVGYNIENPTVGLQATILNYANGFQTTPPNLKTLYLKYQNAGDGGSNTSFAAGDQLTIYNAVTNPIQIINVENGGTGFSNTNALIAVSALAVTLNYGVPSAGQFLNNGNGLTNVEIISVASQPGGSANQYILGIAPRTVDLANTQANAQYWTFNVNDTVTNPANTLGLTVNQLIGAGLQGNIVTSSTGVIVSAPITATGVGYTTDPYITVQSPGNQTGYNTLDLVAQNFLTTVVVASGANTVGNGYAFGITTGVIFQKGMFVEVNPQVIIVDNFNQNPDNVAVGFITNETIVNYNVDPSLLDNANGQQNYQAPGADRMQLIPQLIVLTTAEAVGNASFLPLVQWKAGQPFQQNQQTIYSIIGAEMAQRTLDAEGDFVIDQFVAATQASSNTPDGMEFFNIQISPGTAYISGYRVQTLANFNLDDECGINTIVVNNHTVSLNYGNYLFVDNIGGAFQFNTGATVYLYDSPKNFTGGSNLTANGNLLGTASLRSMVYYQGTPGTPTEQRKIYLYNVQMNPGSNFANVQSVSYQNPLGTYLGIADSILSPSPNGNTQISVLQETDLDQLVFWSGVNSLKNANNVIYTYRTVNTSLTTSNGNVSNATITIDISAGSETFPYGAGALSETQLQDFYVVPTGGDMVYTVSVSGTVVANSSTANVIANSATGFLTNVVAGDWVYVTANSTGGHDLRQVISVVNNTFLVLNSATDFTNTAATLTRAYPQNVPIPFGSSTHPNLAGNVNTNENIITLQFAHPFTFSGSTTTTVAYNVERSNNPTQLTKTANRNQFVMICASNNAANNVGPWCLGVPDIFRLRGVYIGNSSVTNTGTNYVSSFYIDPNQNADFYGLGSLYLKQGASNPVNSSNFMLVQFDYFTTTGVGYYDTVSYLQSSVANTIFVNDSLPLSNLTTFCNTLEVPEIFLDDGTEVDLLEYFDFRPYAANTVAPSTNSSSGVPVNPNSALSFAVTGEKKFPLPDSNFICTVEGWQGRVDSLFVDQNGNFLIETGTSNTNLNLALLPTQPLNTLKIVDMGIPEYPTLPQFISGITGQITNTNIVTNQQLTGTRIANHTVYNLSANSSLPYNQPTVFTMADIGALNAQVQQLQYYVTLNTLEQNAAALNVPSSVNPAENRFAYGIFTDDFSTADFSAISDPEYEAIKLGTDIVPTRLIWDMTLIGSPNIPYIEAAMINQDIATVTPGIPKVNDAYGQPICALNLSNTVAYTTLFRNATDISAGSNTDTVSITMADQATVFANITVSNNSIQQFLINNNYNNINSILSENTLSYYGGVFNIVEALFAFLGVNGNVSQGVFNQPSFSYNSATQTLTLTSPNVASEGVPAVFTFSNIPQSVANLLGQLLTAQITAAQFVSALVSNVQLPAGGSVVDEFYFPPVAFYFYDYVEGVSYNIYQGTTLVASTNPTKGVPSCEDLTASDIALLTGPAAAFWFNDQTNLYMKPFVQVTNDFVSYAGKITFNYNPANGSQFTIVTKTIFPAPDQLWRWVVAYPIDGSSVGCIPSTIPVAVNVNIAAQFSTFNFSASCGNGQADSGQINVLTGITATWNPANITPTTAIVAFDSAADWGPVTAG